MKNNILEEWGKSISQFEKLNIKQAQELYREYTEEKDENKKQLIRNRLIEGTLHVVYNFLKNSGFECLSSNVYDMDDIINSCCESFIKSIDLGKLLTVNNFSFLFLSMFYTNFSNSLIENKYFIGENIDLDSFDFFDIFINFIKIKNRGYDISYKQFVILVKELSKIYMLPLNINEENINKIYNLFNNIYNSCIKDSYSLDLSKTKLWNLKYILLNNGLEYMQSDINDLVIPDYIERLNEQIYSEQIVNEIFNGKYLTLKQRIVLMHRFGLYGEEEKDVKELVNYFRVSEQCIRKIKQDATKRIKRRLKIEEDV